MDEAEKRLGHCLLQNELRATGVRAECNPHGFSCGSYAKNSSTYATANTICNAA